MDELGIALVSPNVRGSSGYGLAYEGLDDGRKREDTVRDIAALLDWIASQRDLDGSRVAVRGGSYGGYMALAAMTHFSHRLRAGIDISGISSLETSLADALDCAVAGWRTEFGDERDPETRQFLRDHLTSGAMLIRSGDPFSSSTGRTIRASRLPRPSGSSPQSGRAMSPSGTSDSEAKGTSFDRREHSLYSQHAQVLFLWRFLLPTE